MVNKRVVFLMIVILLTLAACGGEDGSDVAARPVVQLQVGGQAFETAPFSYCWPDAPGDQVCDFSEALRLTPAQQARVTSGNEIRFVIVGDEAGTPSAFRATLLDENETEDLGTGPEAVYGLEMQDGDYRVQVDVEYADVEGYPSHVSYVFGLTFDGVVAFVPTETPTPTNTPTNTPSPTPTNTPTATHTPSITPTPLGPPMLEALDEDTPILGGPDADSGTMGFIQPGETYSVAGRALDWLQIEFDDSPTGSGWVAVDNVELSGDEAAIADVDPDTVPTVAPAIVSAQETAIAMRAEPTETPMPTGISVETITPVSTGEEPTEAVLVVTATPIPPTPAELAFPTADIAASTAGTDLGHRVLNGLVRAQTTSGFVSLAGVSVTYIHQSAANPNRENTETITTNANGQFTFERSLFVNSGDVIIVTASAPGFQTQARQLNGQQLWDAGGFVSLDLLQEGAVESGEPVPATPAAPSAGEIAVLPENVPPLNIQQGGRVFNPVGFQYCERAASGERYCVEFPGGGQAQRTTMSRGSALEIQVEGERPTLIEVAYRSDEGLPTGQPETRLGDNVSLFTVTAEPGTYILAIHVTWSYQDATYYFQVNIAD